MTTATVINSEFDQAIALEPDPDGAGRYLGELGAGWQIGGGINGGLLLAVAANALRRELPGHPDPLSISCYYLSTSGPGPLSVRTETVRRGRTLSNATASLYQRGPDGAEVERLRVLAGYGDLAALAGEVHTSATAPELPPVEQCIGIEHAPPGLLQQAALLERFDLRLDPGTVGWAVGQPPGRVGSRAGSSWPTGASRTRCRCCWSPTRCRRSPSTSGCPAGPRPSS